MISSAISGEGKTTIGVGLAVALAEDFPNRRLVLVEADVEHKVLAEDFQVASAPGLLECLVNGESPGAACRPTALHNLDLLPAGGPVPYTGRILRSSRTATLLDGLRETYDIVIVDTPGLLVNSDAQLLSDLADGVIFVIRAGVTPANLVNRALEQLEETKVRGLVLNGTQSSSPRWVRNLAGW
jgi:capsular exopolysaccharide synthesis family protein